MTPMDVIEVLGGIALFLYGMSIMGSGLEKVAGGKMQSILQKLTASPLRGLLLGALITAVIQSSAGTIVIVIGLVNSGIMALPAAVGVIMGANIGTTITGQLIRLADISGDSLLLTIVQPKTFSPVVAFIGAILYVFFTKPSKRNIGQIMLGFGILFTGMFKMEEAVAGLRESQLFVQMFTSLENPILGMLAGAAATIAIQSSSASIGILQALSSTGAVTFGNALPIILGAHVGTAFTPLIATAGASRNAKRCAIVDLEFNTISSIIYIIIFSFLQATIGLPFWNDVLNKGYIANIHTLTAAVAAFCILPFGKYLVKLSTKILPDRSSDKIDLSLPVLDERLYKTPSMAIMQAKAALEKMAARSNNNYGLSMGLLKKYDEEIVAQVRKREELIDQMEVMISNYLVNLNNGDLNEAESRSVSQLLANVVEFERIGDYSINVMELAEEMYNKDITFSEQAWKEMDILHGAITEVLQITLDAFDQYDAKIAMRIEPLEETVDSICESLRTRHIARLKAGVCQIESGIQFLDILTNVERISDHCSNVGARIIGSKALVDPDSHSLRAHMHQGETEGYREEAAHFDEKYLQALEKLTAGN